MIGYWFGLPEALDEAQHVFSGAYREWDSGTPHSERYTASRISIHYASP